MRLGGFVLCESSNVVTISIAFVRRELIRREYFLRMLGAFFRHRRWRHKLLLYFTSPVYADEIYVEPRLTESCQPRISTVQAYIDRYDPHD